jgi:hypothetical protein
MSQPEQERASRDQVDDVRRLAEERGEETPQGMRPAEAAQRVEELKSQSGAD